MEFTDELLVDVRTAIRIERVRRRMSQADAARRLGCSRKRLSEFELGQAEPSFRFVADYARLMDIKVSILVPGDDFEQV